MSLYITLLITFGGSILALINPYYGLLAYVTFALIKPDRLWAYSVPMGNYSRILAICMLLGWMMRGFGSWKLGKGWAVTLCLILHVAWVGFGTFFVSSNFVKAYYIFDILLKILLPFLVGMTTIRTIPQLQMLINTIAICIGYLAYELNESYYLRGFNLLMNSNFLDMDNNTFGVVLVTGIGFTMYLVLESRSWLIRCFYGGSLLMMVNAVCFSDSRGTMLGTAITGVVAFVLLPKRPIHFLMFAVLLAGAVRLAGEKTLERFSTVFVETENRDASAQSRLELWSNALSVMLSNPVTGVGPGMWGSQSAKFGWAEGKEVHSTWIQNGAEGGLFGFVVYLAFYLIAIVQLFRIAWRPSPEDQLRPTLMTASRIVLSSLCGYLIAAQFVTAWAVEMSYYVVLVGALVMKLRDASPPELYEEDYEDEGGWYEHDDQLLEEPLPA